MVGISSIKDLDYYSESASGSERGRFILQNAVPGTLCRRRALCRILWFIVVL